LLSLQVVPFAALACVQVPLALQESVVQALLSVQPVDEQHSPPPFKTLVS
jgi:hypothetical protein